MRGCGGSSASATLLALAMFAAPSMVNAQSSADTPPLDDKEELPRHWYGWQTLTVDAVPIALFLAAVPAEGQAEIDLMGIGGLAFAIGGPVLHLAHRRPGFAGASLGIRLGLPIAGSLIGAISSKCEPQPYQDPDDGCTVTTRYAYLGAMVGVFSASILDASLFAFEPVRPPRRGIDGGLASRAFAGVAPVPGGLRLALGSAF